MTFSKKIYAIGNALLDVEYPVTDGILQDCGLNKGTMQLADQTTQQALQKKLAALSSPTGQVGGGSAANTAFAYAAMGLPAFYCCRVANDSLGQFYIKDLADAGVQTSHLSIQQSNSADTDEGTGTCMVLVTPDGERTMQTHLGITGHLSPNQVSLSDLSDVGLLYIEGYLATSTSARQAVEVVRSAARMRDAKIAISLSDPAMVQYAKVGLLDLMNEGVDYLFCNQDEALLFTGETTVQQAALALHEHSKVVIITRGAQGAYISEKQDPESVTSNVFEVPAVPCAQLVDTNGAGDAFAGGFLYGLAQEKHLLECGQIAVRVAAAVVAQFGPRLPRAQYQQFVV